MQPTRQDAEVRLRVEVRGQVQGVGFRPFVWREATQRALAGWVGNDSRGVVLEVEGPASQVNSFVRALDRPPPLARVEEIVTTELATTHHLGFSVRDSALDGRRRALVPPDTATCGDCERELRDPADRRFDYPFVNCTACGPRYTIVQSVPYDRSRTTMSRFPLCTACRKEYEDPANRRFHAEPVCCPDCGPRLTLREADGRASGNALDRAVALLRGGAVLAVKGLGGYHLAADACDEVAVAALRQRKRREHRPFALMVRDLAAAGRLCHVDAAEQELLSGPARPVVLLRRRADAGVAAAVAPGTPTLGVMLPYTPLHVLLLERFGGPLVLTSGNLSDEPIAFQDADAVARLGGMTEAILVHDREIHTRVDDSVMRIVRGRVVPLRRSRGYVPAPLQLPLHGTASVLACGGALKSAFCLTRGAQAFVSHHVGDLDDWATFRAYVDGVALLRRLLDVDPTVVAHDLHPDYPSTRYAHEQDGVELLPVQHHHAHIASCLADNGVHDQVIGVAFDGTGFGGDGTVWGGEFLLADLDGFTRAAHLDPVPMPGGDAAARQPWRMAAAHLDAAYDRAPPRLAVAQRQGQRWEQVLAASRAGVNAPLTSSAGRLFDAVSALLGVRDVVTYEGQAAIELEHLADVTELGSYRVPVTEGAVLRVAVGHLIRSVVEDMSSGVAPAVVAARFHNAVADVVVEVCVRLRATSGLGTVALSGGVFQNALLLTRCLDGLEAAGFAVLTHRHVPPNDGGISLGQAAVASARQR